MLTPIDQPLDKLEDLTPEEMSVPLYYSPSCMLMPVLFCFSLTSENMKGWIEHFTNKYIVCGRLVENDGGEL
jgi:membrane-associated progesterone receptor component